MEAAKLSSLIADVIVEKIINECLTLDRSTGFILFSM